MRKWAFLKKEKGKKRQRECQDLTISQCNLTFESRQDKRSTQSSDVKKAKRM